MDAGVGAKLRNLIKDIGRNSDTIIEFGIVTGTAPLTVQIDATDFDLEADDLIVPQRLVEHTYTIDVELAAAPTWGRTQMTVYNPGLAVGDRLTLAQIKDGQMYVIIDKLEA